MDAIPTLAFLPLALGYLSLRGSDKSPDITLALALADKLAQSILDAPPPKMPLSVELELERIIPLAFAAELQSTSVDTLMREDQRRIANGEPSQILDLSTRRRGMRVRHALKLGP